MDERQFIYADGDNIRSQEFSCLVGSYCFTSPGARHYQPLNANHTYIWVEDPTSGLLYECAVHTRLSINSDMQVCFFREPCPVESWPPFGVAPGQPQLSYRDIGLEQESFAPIGERAIAEQISALGARSDRTQIYGFGHLKGNGLHNIHQNSGEPEKVVNRESYINQDGALVFYFGDRPGLAAHRVWCCLKFEAQSLERMISLPTD